MSGFSANCLTSGPVFPAESLQQIQKTQSLFTLILVGNVKLSEMVVCKAYVSLSFGNDVLETVQMYNLGTFESLEFWEF